MTSRLWDATAVRQQLRSLSEILERYSQLPGNVRASAARTTIEPAIRNFLGMAREDVSGVRVGAGDWDGGDRDVVFDHSCADEWFVDVRLGMDSSPVVGHLEIHNRSQWAKGKLDQDLGRLDDVARVAREHGRKAWTGLAVVGAGLVGRANEIAKTLHDYYHSRSVELVRVSAPAHETWTFIDAVIAPDVLYKKYDLFESKERGSRRWPVMLPMYGDANDGLDTVRPFAIARAFIASFLRKSASPPVEAWSASAWLDSHREAVLGTTSGEQVSRHPGVSVRDDAPPALFYDVYGNADAPWQEWRSDGAQCANGAGWAYRPTHNL